jgi:hypothetical protein
LHLRRKKLGYYINKLSIAHHEAGFQNQPAAIHQQSYTRYIQAQKDTTQGRINSNIDITPSKQISANAYSKEKQRTLQLTEEGSVVNI